MLLVLHCNCFQGVKVKSTPWIGGGQGLNLLLSSFIPLRELENLSGTVGLIEERSSSLIMSLAESAAVY